MAAFLDGGLVPQDMQLHRASLFKYYHVSSGRWSEWLVLLHGHEKTRSMEDSLSLFLFACLFVCLFNLCTIEDEVSKFGL